eukprot:m.111056 g.111056  ORF g.111056 m.111056 type:complete len:191 (+) comp12911_c0_seq1:57-629(+)
MRKSIPSPCGTKHASCLRRALRRSGTQRAKPGKIQLRRINESMKLMKRSRTRSSRWTSMTDPSSQLADSHNELVDLMTKFNEVIKSIDEENKKRDTEIEKLKASVEKLQKENTENFSEKVEDIKSKVAIATKLILPPETVATVLTEAIDEASMPARRSKRQAPSDGAGPAEPSSNFRKAKTPRTGSNSSS